MLLLWLISLLTFWSLSLYLLRRALRGRPTNNHPACAHCSFDLFNRPSTSTRCPECGSDLTTPHAILQRSHRRTPAFIAFSVFLLALATATSLNLAYRLIADPQLLPREPTFLLSLQIRFGPLATPALAQLQSRLLAHAAPPDAASSVLAYILSVQSNPAAKWTPAYGSFIELLRQASLLPDPTWTTYLQHAATITPRLRPSVRFGDPLPIDLTISYRVGTGGLLSAKCASTLSFDNHPPQPVARDGQRSFVASPNFPYPIHYNTTVPTDANLPPGPHAARLTTQLIIGRAFSRPPEPPLTIEQSFSFPIALQPPDHPTVRLLDDPALRDQIAQSILVTVIPGNAPNQPIISLSAPTAPCALAYDVLIRADETEVGRGRFIATKRSTADVFIPVNLPPHSQPFVQIILHPNPQLAAETIDITEICTGDLTILNTPTKPFLQSPFAHRKVVVIPTTRP